MDTSIILLVLLFWFFFGMALRNWFVFSQEKKKLITHIQDVTEISRNVFKKKEKTSTKILTKIFKYGDDFSALGQRINFFSEKHEVELWLRKAGYPYELTVERFQGIKIFLTIIGFFVGFIGIFTGLPLSQFGITLLPLLGYFGTIMALKNKAKKRQEELRYDLPDFLDTVSVSLRAGVSLDQTLREVVKYFSGPLHEEFSRFNQEISLGVPREEAYRDLLKRNDNPEFQSLIKSLIQGVKLGVPIATTFKIQAEDMRVIRKELAKEKAAKASPKVTLITTFVVAPTAIIMIAGLMILNMLFSDGGIASLFR